MLSTLTGPVPVLRDVITRKPREVMAGGYVCRICCSCRPGCHGRDGGACEMIHCCFLSEPAYWWKGKQPHGEEGFGFGSGSGPRHTGKKQPVGWSCRNPPG